jgi:hypothetical protein
VYGPDAVTLRTRRLLAALGITVVLLFAGRWTVFAVAERWWAGSLSAPASSFVITWQLLGLGLDAGAILLASMWFVVHALIVARAIASVQITRRFGNLQLREAVPMRLLLGGAAASGVLLGLIAGAGAHAWREPLMLARQGVTYGVVDPLLRQDIGIYVAQMPVWDLAHRFAALLAFLGVAFCLALYAGIGAIRRDKRAIVVHADARLHLGMLLAFGALVIAAGYLLAPYHLAAAAAPTLTAAGARTRIHAAQLSAGLAIATAFLSLLWALRGRTSLLAAGWAVLAIGALSERFVVPALTIDVPPTAQQLVMIRQLDALAWGIRQPGPIVAADSTPQVTALWDEGMLATLVERRGNILEAATPALVTADGEPIPAWLVAASARDDSLRLDVLVVAEGTTAVDGTPLILRSTESGRPVWRTIADARVRPTAPAWRATMSGVGAGGPLRRLLLAWARQAPGMLRAPPAGNFDWHLNPVERAAAVLPMLSWLPADLVITNGRPTWLIQGMITTPRFPLATRITWEGTTIAGAGPAVIGTIDAASGETHFYADPAADSLGAAWIRIVGTLVAPAATLPPSVRSQLSYAGPWFEAQINALRGPNWNLGQVATSAAGDGAASVPVWITANTPGREVELEESGRGGISTIAYAYRADGFPQLRLEHHDPDGTAAGNRVELRQLWSHSPMLSHLRDSVLAAGDSATPRNVRWTTGPAGLAAWQPLFAVPRSGPPTLLWIATAVADHLGGGKAAAEAWLAALDWREAEVHGLDSGAQLEQAREWLQRADSAFRRGDMTAFGRAYEELRRVLGRKP